MQIYITLFFSVSMIFGPIITYAGMTDNETSIAIDLNTALTLEGINCDGVSDYEQTDEDSFDVICKSGGSFSIDEIRNGVISITDKITGAAYNGLKLFLGIIPMTGQILQKENRSTVHDAEIARSLFSIIELSGNACDGITRVITNSSNEHIVTCENTRKYHVYTRSNGQVAVDFISTESS